MFAEPFESRTKSFKNRAAGTTTRRQSTMEKLLRILFHAQKRVIFRMKGDYTKSRFNISLSHKAASP